MSEANIPTNRPNDANHARRSISGAILALAGAILAAADLHMIVRGFGGIIVIIGFWSWVWHTYHRD